MDRLDELLAESRPRVTPPVSLGSVTARVTARRRRGLILAGVVTLSVASGTAAVAGNTPLDDRVDYSLSGDQPEHNDHAWEMDITGLDGAFHCIGGIVVLPATERPEYNEADYLAAKKFIQDGDWSELEPDRSLLNPGQRGTAEELAITVDKTMSNTALTESGLPLTSIMTRGTAECSPK